MRILEEKTFLAGEVVLRYKSKNVKKKQVATSENVYNLSKEMYDEGEIDYRENFVVMLLNNNADMLGWIRVSEGGVTQCPVDIRMIFQSALLANATCIILIHNHPSGNLKPSIADISLTKDVVNAGKIMNIRVLDHVIVSKDDYYSFSENGKL